MLACTICYLRISIDQVVQYRNILWHNPPTNPRHIYMNTTDGVHRYAFIDATIEGHHPIFVIRVESPSLTKHRYKLGVHLEDLRRFAALRLHFAAHRGLGCWA